MQASEGCSVPQQGSRKSPLHPYACSHEILVLSPLPSSNAHPSQKGDQQSPAESHLGTRRSAVSMASESVHHPLRDVSYGRYPPESRHPVPSFDWASIPASLEVESGTLYSRDVAVAKHASLTKPRHAVFRVNSEWRLALWVEAGFPFPFQTRMQDILGGSWLIGHVVSVCV